MTQYPATRLKFQLLDNNRKKRKSRNIFEQYSIFHFRTKSRMMFFLTDSTKEYKGVWI